MIIEEILIRYLAEKLNPIEVSGLVPENPPENFVTVEKTGRTQKNTINRTVLAVQSYAPSLSKAAALSEQVIGAVIKMPLYENVGRVELINEHNFTDTRKKQFRYQAIFAINY